MPAVYTRTGDKGTTGLFGGSRVSKDDARVEAYGALDEANSAIGVAKANMPAGQWRDAVHKIQHRLFVVGAELASDESGREILAGKVDEDDITELERLIDKCLEFAGPQRFFVVPGRDPASAHLHLARTMVRRAERRIITGGQARPELIKYVNRLSDTMYALARVVETMYTHSRIADIVRRVVTEALQGAGGPRNMQTFDLTSAQAMAAAALAKADEMGVPIVFAAVDAGGNLLLLNRQPDSLLVSLDLAVGKAYTAAALKQATAGLKPLAVEDGPLYGIEASNQGRIVLFGGGEPVFVGGRIAGGIGVSGGTVEEDIEIVTHALQAANGVNP